MPIPNSEFRRINIDILGNADALVHAHTLPRYEWEPTGLLQRPVWLYDTVRWRDPATALAAHHNTLRASIGRHLRSLADTDDIRITG